MNREHNDINQKTLNWALAHSPTPQILQELVDLSYTHFGWFAKHGPRAFEYPWIVTEMGDISGKTVLDVGAGVSPLPIFLAEQGAKVVTIDNSPLTRQLGQGEVDCHGWGYLDYATLNPNISSVNDDILAVNLADQTFDCIYSVSVIEHLPAAVRQKLWSTLARWLRQDGLLLLTVDLFPGTDQLWNYCLGNMVDPDETHGDLTLLKAELHQAGFRLAQSEFLPELKDSRTDCALLRFVRRR